MALVPFSSPIIETMRSDMLGGINQLLGQRSGGNAVLLQLNPESNLCCLLPRLRYPTSSPFIGDPIQTFSFQYIFHNGFSILWPLCLLEISHRYIITMGGGGGCSLGLEINITLEGLPSQQLDVMQMMWLPAFGSLGVLVWLDLHWGNCCKAGH